MDFEALVENCTQGICVVQDGEVAYSNSAYEDMFDYKVDLPISRCEDCVLNGVCKAANLMCLKGYSIKPNKTSQKIEFIGTTKDGTKRYFRSSVISIMWHGKPATQVSTRDITDDMSIELEQISILETVANNIRVGLWQANGEGILTYVNDYYCDIFEQTRKDIIGVPFERFADDFSFMDKSEYKHSKEIEITLDDGIQKWVKITCNRVKNGFVGTIADITTNKIYLPELIKLRDEIKREKIR